MPLKFFRLDETPVAPGICIYGPTGAGKTTLIGTMPGHGLYIDVPQVEGGGFVLGDKASRIDAVKCEEWEDINEIYWALQQKDSSVLPNVKDIRWVAIDSISGMAEMAKRKVINERDRSLGEAPHKITLPEWGFVGQLVGELIYRFRSLDYWLIIIAQERTHGGRDDDPSPVQIGPDLTAAALRALKPSLTIIGRLGVTTKENGEEERQLRIGPPDGEYIVKARTTPGKKLPRLIRDPHLGRIFGYLFGNGPRPKAAKDHSSLSF